MMRKSPTLSPHWVDEHLRISHYE